MSLSRFRVPVRATCLCSSCPRTAQRSSSPITLSQAQTPIQSQFPSLVTVRHATHGAQGRANGPKSGPGKRLGAKKTGEQYVIPGNIIFRQRGTKWFPGENVGMGRDHTLFSRATGYVKYYRDPFKHPKRQYIGVVFERDQTLPAPRHLPRRRKLGLLPVPRTPNVTEEEANAPEQDTGNEVGILHDDVGNMGISIAQAAKTAHVTKNEVREVRRKKATGRPPVEQLQMRPDYSFRESNWSVGLAADRADVRVVPFKKGHRFLAWRKRTAKRERAKEMASLSKKKGKPKAKKRS